MKTLCVYAALSIIHRLVCLFVHAWWLSTRNISPFIFPPLSLLSFLIVFIFYHPHLKGQPDIYSQLSVHAVLFSFQSVFHLARQPIHAHKVYTPSVTTCTCNIMQLQPACPACLWLQAHIGTIMLMVHRSKLTLSYGQRSYQQQVLIIDIVSHKYTHTHTHTLHK